MNTETNTLSELRKEITVTLSWDETAEVEKSVISNFMLQAAVPKFRKGKAPESIVRAHYAKEIQEEFASQMVSKAYQDGLKNLNLNIYSIVSVNNMGLSTGQENKITFVVDEHPNVEIPDYACIEVKVKEEPVKEEEVENMVKHMLNQHATFTKVQRPAQKGDFTRIDYIGYIEGKRIDEIQGVPTLLGTQLSTWEEVGANALDPAVPAIVQGLEGMSIDEKKVVQETFPADHAVKELAGKTADYSITLLEVQERTLPEMNEAFFQKLQVKSMEELKEQARKTIETRHKNNVNYEKKKQIEQFFKDTLTFPVPQSAIENRTQSVLRQKITQAQKQGLEDQQIIEQREEFYQQAQKEAEQSIRVDEVLWAIAKKESIEVTKEDLQKALYLEAMASRVPMDKVFQAFKDNENYRNKLSYQVLVNKALDFLAEKVKVVSAE